MDKSILFEALRRVAAETEEDDTLPSPKKTTRPWQYPDISHLNPEDVTPEELDRLEQADLDEALSLDSDTYQEAEYAEQEQRIREFVKSLPELERKVVEYRLEGNQNLKKLAPKLGVTVHQVLKALASAQVKIREWVNSTRPPKPRKKRERFSEPRRYFS